MSKKSSLPSRPGIWRIAGQLSRRQYWMFAVLGLFVPFVMWSLYAASSWVDPIFLPGPLKVVTRLYTWLVDDNLLGDAAISIYRVSAGFGLSALLALPLGLLIGAFRPAEALLEPLIDFIRYMPAVAFIPLVMLWLGIGESAKISIIFIGTFFQMVLMIAENVRLVPLAQIEAALTMGATRFEMVRLVLAQSARPAMLDTLRITMGWAWTYLVVAELVAANSGLGYAILKAQRYLKTDTIFGGIILVGVIGLLLDQGFRYLHRRLYPWAQARV
ncbi:Putative aliphatic sulfonates transport permease protein SsuC [Polaromonas vacuolata]|uniref:Aliphatic sulfonates transport permease protein SsuC n=1 Tax=Polaromonas vacuolata TaxID=37448 RepID=A0A6H2HBZ8_9BURK|nr:ABC transporter permease [Polaromonas vacuolata]QJC57287.1 Putative aliphatic sulfonates transport permease protein SsuC [Polaromonas vacuolata]